MGELTLEELASQAGVGAEYVRQLAESGGPLRPVRLDVALDLGTLLLLLFEAFFVAVLTVLAMLVEIFIGGLSRPAANVGGYVLMAVMLFPWFAVVELMRRKV